MAKLKDYVYRIPILDLSKQIRILRDEELDNSTRAFVGVSFLLSVCYFVLPVDIIPDLILGFGYIDDLTFYAILREIGYKAAENDCGVIEASKVTLRSKIFKLLILILAIITVLILILTYFLI